MSDLNVLEENEDTKGVIRIRKSKEKKKYKKKRKRKIPFADQTLSIKITGLDFF